MRLRYSVCIAFAFAAIVVLAASTFAAAPIKAVDSAIVAKCKADLAKRLHDLRAQDIKLIEAKPTTWPNAALGMPEMGKVYVQTLTPGLRVTLEAKNTRYFYATSAKAIKYAGPVDIWDYSMLYTKPIKNEPNLNGDLYQCSLLGTNCVRLASGVSDIYPQLTGGLIMYTLRTSRSGFNLLYINAKSPKPKLLYRAFAFAGAAFADKQDRWAALVKPGLGVDWTVVVAPASGDLTKKQSLPVPDDFRAEQVAWSGDKVMLLGKHEERLVAFEITPTAEKPEWKAVAAYLFPLMPDYMLNKSESLDISDATDGKKAVEVARVWFTGDRNVIARIEGMTLRGNTLLPKGYAFIWGEKNDKPVAYTVDISTGEVIPSVGVGNNLKPFLYPPKSSPLGTKTIK
jgi:hypothetical protein